MPNPEDKYGTKIGYDPLWKGPMDIQRYPTDRIWLFTFIIFVIIFVSSAMYAFLVGDINKLGGPTDYSGRICGIDPEVRNKPFLFYINLKDGLSYEKMLTTPSVCVSQCPTENFIYQKDSSTLTLIKDKIICTIDVNISAITTFEQLDIFVWSGKCSQWYLKSEPVSDRCMAFNAWEGHEDETISSDQLYKVREEIRNQAYFVESFYINIKTAMGPAAVAIICGGMIAFLYVIALKWFAVPFFYASIAMFITFMVYSVYRLCIDYHKYQTGETLFALIVVLILIVCVILAVIFCRRKIYLACQLIKESSKAVIHLPSTLAFPIIPWTLYIFLFIFSVLVGMSLLSVTKPEYRIERVGTSYEDLCNCTNHSTIALADGALCDPTEFNNECNANGQPCQFLQCNLYRKYCPDYLYFFHSINIVGFLWILYFISGFEHMVLSGTFATWYWNFNKDAVQNNALIRSLTRTTRYHLGTIALGSLILTISQLIRLIFQAIHNRLHQGNQAIASSFMLCCRCFFDVLDNLLNFLNYNAYIMCAIHGQKFCRSARDAFNLIMRNVVNIIVVDTIVDWLFIIAKILVTSIATTGVAVYYNYNETTNDESLGTALIITAIGTYIIASVFFSVQSIAVNTVFLCFIEDSERNDGSDIRPYYMSNKLKQLLHKGN